MKPWLLQLAVVVGGIIACPGWAQEKIRVLLIDGQNNHNYVETTPVMKKYLESTGGFSVDVSTYLHPEPSKRRKHEKAHDFDTVSFPPDLSKYQVVLSNYNGISWPKEFNEAFEKAVKEGTIGLVIVHAANNAFTGWQEYDLMMGMGWRNAGYGKRLKVDDQGKQVIVPAKEDLSSGHRYTGPFSIVIRDAEHPVTKGMPLEWLHGRDELYDNMRGPIENIHLLATAYSGGKGTKTHEPMIWTISYGKGRVFHTPMGHDANAMNCIGYLVTLARGLEWATTGNVTFPIPANFPTKDKESSQLGKN